MVMALMGKSSITGNFQELCLVDNWVDDYPMVMTNRLLLSMAIEIVSVPQKRIKHGDFTTVMLNYQGVNV